MLPSHNQQIESLCNLVQKGLNLETAEQLVQVCSNLAQDSGTEAIFFYTLKNIFADVASALDGQAVDADRYDSLTCETQKELLHLLEPLQQNLTAEVDKLEILVSNHIARLSVFRAK